MKIQDRLVNEIRTLNLARTSWKIGKKGFLSKVSELILIKKNVLLSLPVCYLSHFMAPKSFPKVIEKIIRCFLYDDCLLRERKTSKLNCILFTNLLIEEVWVFEI